MDVHSRGGNRYYLTVGQRSLLIQGCENPVSNSISGAPNNIIPSPLSFQAPYMRPPQTNIAVTIRGKNYICLLAVTDHLTPRLYYPDQGLMAD